MSILGCDAMTFSLREHVLDARTLNMMKSNDFSVIGANYISVHFRDRPI